MNSDIEDLKSHIKELEMQINIYQGKIKNAEQDIKGWKDHLEQLEAEKGGCVQELNNLNED